jgi:hypothetical protein
VRQHYKLKEKHSLYLYNYLDFPSRLRISCLIILIFNTGCVGGVKGSEFGSEYCVRFRGRA